MPYILWHVFSYADMLLIIDFLLKLFIKSKNTIKKLIAIQITSCIVNSHVFIILNKIPVNKYLEKKSILGFINCILGRKNKAKTTGTASGATFV